ncbi:DUF2357 domain-containing protein [Frateuria sp. GZRe14]|uniref:DUF2357 domain-containing protein n=1 Tax=Frateuria sp. GZRe14 TaxID=3351534 RepID=UPI003EDBE4C3
MVGTSIDFEERREYLLTFPEACDLRLRAQITELGGEMLGDDTALIGFGNFVGETQLAGVAIDVISSKIGPDGVSKLLEEVSELATSLIFSHGSPTIFRSDGVQSHTSPVPYHQLQLLRKTMLGDQPGRRLQDWLAVIERNPTRRFEQERPVVSVDRVRRLDQRAMASVFHRMERLSVVPAGSAVVTSPLAKVLKFGAPPALHFPNHVATPRGRLSYDTAENRFVRHAVEGCLALIYRFVDHPKLHPRLRADCRLMLSILEHTTAQPFVTGATRLNGFASPSQALAKADGYREVFSFWMRLQEQVSLPTEPGETQRLLEGRDMASLYEYWVFMKVLEAVVAATGVPPDAPPTIIRNEMGDSIQIALPTFLGEDLSVSYNPSYTRSEQSAYSTPLRPDVILRVGADLHAFDAKYRLDFLNTNEDDADEDSATYKRADLYKMHTYRDAIRGLKTAFVVYPGSQFRFFDRQAGLAIDPQHLVSADGVGAIPLRPATVEAAAALRVTIQRLIAISYACS